LNLTYKEPTYNGLFHAASVFASPAQYPVTGTNCCAIVVSCCFGSQQVRCWLCYLPISSTAPVGSCRSSADSAVWSYHPQAHQSPWLRLPVPGRIRPRIAHLTCRSLSGSALSYLSAYLTRVAYVPRLRSASYNRLTIPTFFGSPQSADGIFYRSPAPTSGPTYHVPSSVTSVPTWVAR